MLSHDFGADAFVGEDFQQHGMGHAAIYEGDFLDAGLHGGHGAITLGIMPLSMTPVCFRAATSLIVRREMTLAGFLGSAQQAGHVAHEDKAPGLEGDGRLGGGDVGVAVIDLAVLAVRRGADDRGDALADALEQRGGVYRNDFAHIAQVQRLADPGP